MTRQRGMFITFEGIDGCGKSTQAILLGQHLREMGKRVLLLREPGSTPTAERIRRVLLDRRLDMNDVTELLLYEAARAEVTSREIEPALRRGTTVLCDRYYDSTTAYQGYGRKLDIRMIRGLHRVAVGSTVPDITLLFDLNLSLALARRTGQPDRLESQPRAFFNRVRKGFLEIARRERRRVKVIDASNPVEEVFRDVKKVLARKLAL